MLLALDEAPFDPAPGDKRVQVRFGKAGDLGAQRRKRLGAGHREGAARKLDAVPLRPKAPYQLGLHARRLHTCGKQRVDGRNRLGEPAGRTQALNLGRQP